MSKTVGFIEFFPLEWFRYDPLPNNIVFGTKKIYGFEKDTIYGFINRFEDYFHHFESGDVYEWYLESTGYLEYRERWRWDSILTADFTAEGVNLEIFRTDYSHWIYDGSSMPIDTTWTTTEIVSETIERQFFTPFFQSATQALYPMQDFVDVFSGSEAFLIPHLPKILPSGQVYESIELYDLHSINLGNCNMGQSTDFSKSEHYKTGIGAVRKSSGVYPGFSNLDTLICYKKNGVWYGENCDPILNTATNDVSEDSFAIQIIPNPAVSTILVKSPSIELYRKSWQIFDYQGKAVKKGQFSSDFHKINVDRLPTGFYFLQMEIDGKMSVEKFLKQ